MTVRDAKFADIPQMVALLVEACARSVYADKDGAVDEAFTKTMLVNAINRHGRTGPSGFWVQVAERGGIVEGFIVGILDRVQLVGTKLYATDLFFVCSDRVDARDPIRLLKGFIAWAESAPACRQITMGVTDVMGGDVERRGKLYERCGLKPAGAIYEKWVAPS